jgi:biotin transport system substrate-specific component
MKKLDVRKITLSSMLLALLILSAFISIPIPFTTIKITLQTMVVFIIGSMISPIYCFMTVLLYIALGLFGLPVFSSGSGIMYIFTPSFGFIIGFLLAAPLMSYINRRTFSTRLVRYIVSCSIGILLIYAIGVPYMYYVLKLYMSMDISFGYALISGGLMFLPFDILKAAAAYPVANNSHIRRLTSEHKI